MRASPSLYVVHALQHCAWKVLWIEPARVRLEPARTAGQENEGFTEDREKPDY